MAVAANNVLIEPHRQRMLFALWAVFWLIMILVGLQDGLRSAYIHWWEPLLSYLNKQLLEPLGAHQFVTEFDPAGHFMPGHALFIGAEDLARLGLLWQNGGTGGPQSPSGSEEL